MFDITIMFEYTNVINADDRYSYNLFPCLFKSSSITAITDIGTKIITH